MIQRIQTVYMFLAIVMLILCACMPIGTYYPEGMGGAKTLYNLAIIDSASASWDFTCAGLVFFLALPAVFTAQNIFQYNNRKRQITYCKISIWLLVLWYVLYAVTATMLCPKGYTFDTNVLSLLPAILPTIGIIFLWLAKRGINHDEKLIRSIDRIR